VGSYPYYSVLYSFFPLSFPSFFFLLSAKGLVTQENTIKSRRTLFTLFLLLLFSLFFCFFSFPSSPLSVFKAGNRCGHFSIGCSVTPPLSVLPPSPPPPSSPSPPLSFSRLESRQARNNQKGRSVCYITSSSPFPPSFLFVCLFPFFFLFPPLFPHRERGVRTRGLTLCLTPSLFLVPSPPPFFLPLPYVKV